MGMFMFATGIENSSPTIKNARVRVDEMELCGHYQHWRTDFEKVQELGIRFLRYGTTLHRTFLGPERFDWSFADVTFGDLKEREIIPIADLCHFGVPEWIGNFQNPDFPKLFGEYALAFARRFPWVQLYTPVNEMYICAQFSARYGWWNEQLKSDSGFVTALKHIVRANILAMRAILTIRPGCDLHSKRGLGIFSRRKPGGNQAGRNKERRAVPVPGFELWQARGVGHVRISDGQRHDARGIPLLSAEQPETSLRDGERLLSHERASSRT